MAKVAKSRSSPVRPARCCCAVRGGRMAARADSRSADGVVRFGPELLVGCPRRRVRVGRGAEAL
eukprot:2526877-Lingulodinium_polyedra.AAC.1